MRELYRERAALEREYASKLQSLAKKYSDKNNKKIPALVIGTDSTKSWGQDVIKQRYVDALQHRSSHYLIHVKCYSTLENAHTSLITSMNDVAQEHINLADSLNSQVVEVLKNTGRKYDDRKKKLVQHFQKLLSDRDHIYSNRSKVCVLIT